MEALYATDNQILLGTTCRMQAAKQHVHTVPDPVSTASETFSRVAHRSVSRRLMSPSLSLQPTQNGPWTTEEDEILSAYRTQGYGWAQIQEKHFPSKSANACRKRHERLMTKRRSAAWDESRLESLAVNYRGMREHIWRCLADRLGEKWEHVEKICMQQGLKDLLNRAANYRRIQSRASSSSQVGKLSAGENENWYDHGRFEHDSQDDSAVCLLNDRGDQEVQKAKSKSSSRGWKPSSSSLYGAGVGASSKQPTLDSVSRIFEYRRPSTVVTRSASRDSQNRKEVSIQFDRVERAAEEARPKFSQSSSTSESTQSSRPLHTPVFPSHTAHPIQQHGQQPPPLGRPPELRPAEEADHKHSVGREDLLDRILHLGGDRPPPDGRTSISPSNLGELTPAMHASEVPEVLSLRRDGEDKLKNIEGLKIDPNSIREYGENLGERVAARNEEKRSLQPQVQHLRGGTLSTINDNAKEGDDQQNNLPNLQKCSELSQKKVCGQEQNAEHIQASGDRDRQTCDAERCMVHAIRTERDQARRGSIDFPKRLKSPPKVLSLSPPIQQEAPPIITAPQCGQRRDHPYRHGTSISECTEDSRHRRAGLLVEAQVSPDSAEALDSPRVECSLSGFTSESERSFTDSVGSYAGFGIGCDQLNGLLQELHEALVREMVQDYMTTVENPGYRAHTPSNSAASSNSNAESRTGDSAIHEPSNAVKSRGKRRRDDEDDGGDDGEDDENPDRRRHKRQETAGSNSDVIPEKLFACPYFKLDPSRYSQRNTGEKKYRGCSSCFLIDISRLKQHLYRVHGRPDYYCGSCFQEFKTRVLLDTHTRQRPSCKLSECPFDEKMDSDQKIQIKRRRFGQNPSEAWYDIWRILFPNSDAPESPFSEIASTIAVQSLFERFRTRAPLMLSRLVRDRIQDSMYLADYQQLLLENAQEEAMAQVIQTFRGELEDLELSMTVMSSNDRSLCTGRNSTPSGSLPVSVVSASDHSTRVNPIPLPEIVSSAASGAPLGNGQQSAIEHRSFQTSFASLPTLGLSLTPGEVTGPNWMHSNKPDDTPFFSNTAEQTGADALARIYNSDARQPDAVDHEHHLWHVSSAAASADYAWFDCFSGSNHHLHDC